LITLFWGGIATWVLFERAKERREELEEANMSKSEKEERLNASKARVRELFDDMKKGWGS